MIQLRFYYVVGVGYYGRKVDMVGKWEQYAARKNTLRAVRTSLELAYTQKVSIIFILVWVDG